MPDLGSIAAPAGFLTALMGLLGYLTKAVISDRSKYAGDLEAEQARTARAETALERAQDELDRALIARRAADTDLATAEAEMEGLRTRLANARSEKEWAWREIGRMRQYMPPAGGPLLPDQSEGNRP